MMPGRSLSAKASPRSMAPEASTARLATMRQPRWRGSMRGRHGEMVVDALDRAIGALVVDAIDRGARHQPHGVEAGKLGEGALDPVERRRAIQAGPLGQEPPAEAEILLGEDHAGAGARRGERRHEARRAGADHQHVAMGVGLLVAVGVGVERGAAKPGAAPDQRLVELASRSPPAT